MTNPDRPHDQIDHAFDSIQGIFDAPDLTFEQRRALINLDPDVALAREGLQTIFTEEEQAVCEAHERKENE